MGPRSNDRGNEHTSAAKPERVEASMGPRSNDRGNVLGGELGYWLKALLQWGRDQMIAEIAWSPNPWLSKSCGQHCERSRRPLIRLIAHPTSSDAKLSVFN